MAGKFKVAKNANQSEAHPSGTFQKGGDYALDDAIIRCTVKIGANDEADGYIVRRKGARKFIVSDGTNEGVCTLADTPPYAEDELEEPIPGTGLEDDTFVVVCTRADESEFMASKIDNKFVWDQDNVKYLTNVTAADANTSPPTVQVTAGSPPAE